MRMVNEDNYQPIQRLWLTMTEAELRELHQHLVTLFDDEPVVRPWHSHFGEDATAR